MDVKQIYIDTGALLKGHFLLSSGKHSQYYLQSAKILQYPEIATKLAKKLSTIILEHDIQVDTVCSPAIGGLLAGYELSRMLKSRFIFTERVNNVMTLRRGFTINTNEKILICEDVITTGGSALEAANVVEKLGAQIVAYASIANRGFCKKTTLNKTDKIENEQNINECKLPKNIPFFSLVDFKFEVYDPQYCPLCKEGSMAYKPGSRNN